MSLGPSTPGPRNCRPARPGGGSSSSPSHAPRPDGDAAPTNRQEREGRQNREGRQDWLNTQLRRLYDDVVAEPVPDDLLDLVRRLEQGDAGDTPVRDAPLHDDTAGQSDDAASGPAPSSRDRR
jgi:hypothetical protein